LAGQPARDKRYDYCYKHWDFLESPLAANRRTLNIKGFVAGVVCAYRRAKLRRLHPPGCA
jgi:hypothetical protein